MTHSTGSGTYAPPSEVSETSSASAEVPRPRPHWLRRPRLLHRLDAGVPARVLLAAPPGWGKTTLLAQWAQTCPAPVHVVWVSLDDGDDDPRALGSRLLTAVGWTSRRTLLLLDDVDACTSPGVQAMLGALLAWPPPSLTIGIASRVTPDWLVDTPGLVRLGTDDLAFTDLEAGRLLRWTLGEELPAMQVRDLQERTGGWPAALCVAASALSGRPAVPGDDGPVRDAMREYVAETILPAMDPRLRDFLRRTSILDQLEPAACAAVTGLHGVGPLLDLARAEQVVTTDEAAPTIRLRPLVRDALREDLRESGDEAGRALHRRAAAWFEADGNLTEALHHAAAGGDRRRLDALGPGQVLALLRADRAADLRAWRGAYDQAGVPHEPGDAVTAAWLAAVDGDAVAVARWSRLAAREVVPGPVAEFSSGDTALVVLQALLGDGPLTDLLGPVREAAGRESRAGTPDLAAARLASAWVSYLLERPAVEPFTLAVRTASAHPELHATILAASTLAMVDADPARAGRCAVEALRRLRRLGLDAHPAAWPALVVAGCHDRDADPEVAADRRRLGRDLAAGLEPASPWPAVVAGTLLGAFALDGGDRAAAAASVHEVQAVQRRRGHDAAEYPRLTHLRQRLADLPDEFGHPLSDRETQVLRRLRGRLDQAEIADQLGVSPNTVKSHLRMVYRKLGVGSRADAVAVAVRRGIL